MGRLAAVLLIALLLEAGSQARAEVRALVVGVDRYRELPTLGGAVADAVDVSDSLRAAGAVVTTLRDQEVTRESFRAAWRETLSGAGADDVLVVFFAGHGIQIPDLDGDEADGLDEAFVLPRFRIGIRDDENLIVDDEIDDMVRHAAPRMVIVIADTCHSGTLTRAVDQRADFRAARFVPRSVYGGVGEDRPAPQRMTGPAAEPARNSVLFAAVPEDLLMQEVLIDGNARGALSWSFSRGIEGAADADQNGIITIGELVTYVPERVRALSQSRQTPVVTARGGMAVGLFADLKPEREETEEPGTTALATPSPAAVPESAAVARLRLALDGPQAADGARTISQLSGVEIAADPGEADLIWHLPSGDVLTAHGDVAARLGTAREPRILQGVVAKWRLLRALERRIDGTLGTRLRPDDRLYGKGESLTMELASDRTGRLIVFDLAADGSVILVLPRPGDEAPAITPGTPYTVPLRAGPPFGADHLVAVRTETTATAGRLVDLLRAVHGRPFEMQAVEGSAAALGSAAVGTAAVYTTP